jgi:hypothetical protein
MPAEFHDSTHFSPAPHGLFGMRGVNQKDGAGYQAGGSKFKDALGRVRADSEIVGIDDQIAGSFHFPSLPGPSSNSIKGDKHQSTKSVLELVRGKKLSGSFKACCFGNDFRRLTPGAPNP